MPGKLQISPCNRIHWHNNFDNMMLDDAFVYNRIYSSHLQFEVILGYFTKK